MRSKEFVMIALQGAGVSFEHEVREWLVRGKWKSVSVSRDGHYILLQAHSNIVKTIRDALSNPETELENLHTAIFTDRDGIPRVVMGPAYEKQQTTLKKLHKMSATPREILGSRDRNREKLRDGEPC